MVRVFSALLLATAFALAPACPSARAQEEPAPAKPAAIIKLDITETIEGKPDRDNRGVYALRKKLREFGFLVWTEKPLRVDEIERKKREKEAAETGAKPGGTTATATVDERPAPDLVIKGVLEVFAGKTSTFYGETVAYEFVGQADLTITDAKTSKQLGVVEERDEWGHTKLREAREDTHKRIIAWVTAGVLRQEALRGKLGPKRQAALDEYVKGVDEKRDSSAREREAEKHGEDGKPAEGKKQPGDARKPGEPGKGDEKK